MHVVFGVYEQSRRQGLHFSVVVIDAPHSVSGQAAAREFADAGIYVTYTMLNGELAIAFLINAGL